MESNAKRIMSAIKNIQSVYSKTSVIGSSPSRASTKTFHFSVETKTASDILNSSILASSDTSINGLKLGFTMLNISGIFNDSIMDKPISVQVDLSVLFNISHIRVINAKSKLLGKHILHKYLLIYILTLPNTIGFQCTP